MLRNVTRSALFASAAVAGDDLGAVVRHLEVGVERADHATHVAAVGEVDVLVALEVVEGVAGGQHIGVGEIDPGVAVGVGVGNMGELRLAAAGFHHLRAAEVGFLGQRVRGLRRHLGAGQAIDRAGGEAGTDVVVRHDDDAVLGEVRVPAGVVAMIVRVDQVFDRERRYRLDRRSDLVGQRRELPIHLDDAVGADRNGDVAALAFQHVGLVAEVSRLDLDLVPVDQRRRRRRGGRLLRVGRA